MTTEPKGNPNDPSLEDLQDTFDLAAEDDLATRAMILLKIIRKLQKEDPKMLLSLHGKLEDLRRVIGEALDTEERP